MPAPATNEELFALIAKSGVLDDARVQGYLDRLRQAGTVPNDPIKLGGMMVRDGLLTHFQAEQLLQGRWKRFSIGRYRVLERLGVGGMGQVFLCEHKLMKRKVAVKVLPAAKAKDEAALQRFYREARAVAAVDHPNIVRAYDMDSDDDLHFLVMEYVDGSNLHDIVKKSGPLPPLRACHYMYGAAVGLQHAHEMGLVHRDVKPANILIDRSGTVKILDMGLARFFNPEADDHLTKKFEENVLGTADYLAPEQAMDSTAVDIRADIYGLGGTFYYLLTGQPPYPDGTVAQKLLWHQSKPPRPITTYRKDVPPQLLAVVDRMLAKNPAERYQTPAEVVETLAPWVQTPIAPPSEAELPQVSVAAGGRSSTGSAKLPTLPHPAPSPRGVGTGVAPRPGTTTPPPATRANPVVVQPATVARPPASEPANVWADLRNSETIPTADDTARTRRPKAAPTGARSREPKAARKTPLLLWLILAGVGGAVLLGGVATVAAFVLFGGFSTATSSAETDRSPTTWYVSKGGEGPDPDHTRQSMAEVFLAIKSGDEVVILDDEIECGPLQLIGTRVRDLRITAGNASKSVTWVYTPPAGAKLKPLAAIELRNCDNITLSGLVVDVRGHLDIGVQLTGLASGVRLEGLTVRNANLRCVNLRNVEADPSRPLTVVGCRFVLGKNAEAGVNLDGTAEVDCRGVRIVDSRFEGVGHGNGVRVEGATSDVVLKNNRLFNLEHGVWVVGDVQPKCCELAIEQNTFHTMQVGVCIDQPPVQKRKVVVRRNYFAATGMAATAVETKGLEVSANGCDTGTNPGVSEAVVVEKVTIPKPKPDAPNDQFLRGDITLNGGRIGAE